MDGLIKSHDDVYGNTRIKYVYNRDGYYYAHEIMVSGEKIFNKGNYEKIGGEELKLKSGESQNNDIKSKGRARRSIYDYVMCNPEMDVFITLTLDQQKIDRYSYDAVIVKLNQWLSNLVQRHENRYIIVPEYHKDGAIHFHGLCTRGGLKLEPSGKYDKGNPIFNITNWILGFTTAKIIECDTEERVAKYITKYITKQSEKVGGRYYLHSSKLRRPAYKVIDIDYEDIKKDPIDMYGVTGIKVLNQRDADFYKIISEQIINIRLENIRGYDTVESESTNSI